MGCLKAIPFVAAAMLGAACSEGQPARAADSADSVPMPAPRAGAADSTVSPVILHPDSLLANIYRITVSLPRTRAAARVAFGDPDSILATEHVNVYDGGRDSIGEFHFGALSIQFWWSPSQGREFPTAVAVADSQMVLADPIAILATTAQELRDLLGPPTYRSEVADTLLLSYPSPLIGPDEYVEFRFVAQLLRRVRWEFFFE